MKWIRKIIKSRFSQLPDKAIWKPLWGSRKKQSNSLSLNKRYSENWTRKSYQSLSNKLRSKIWMIHSVSKSKNSKRRLESISKISWLCTNLWLQKTSKSYWMSTMISLPKFKLSRWKLRMMKVRSRAQHVTRLLATSERSATFSATSLTSQLQRQSKGTCVLL